MRRPIEEFRSRIRQASQAGEPAAEQLARATAAYLKLLDDCSAFYTRLMVRLQQRYGSVGVALELPTAQVRGGWGAACGRLRPALSLRRACSARRRRCGARC